MDPELDEELSAWMLPITIAHTEVGGPIALALARNGFTMLESLDFSETELKEFTGLPIGIVRSFRRTDAVVTLAIMASHFSRQR